MKSDLEITCPRCQKSFQMKLDEIQESIDCYFCKQPMAIPEEYCQLKMVRRSRALKANWVTQLRNRIQNYRETKENADHVIRNFHQNLWQYIETYGHRYDAIDFIEAHIPERSIRKKCNFKPSDRQVYNFSSNLAGGDFTRATLGAILAATFHKIKQVVSEGRERSKQGDKCNKQKQLEQKIQEQQATYNNAQQYVQSAVRARNTFIVFCVIILIIAYSVLDGFLN